MALAIVSSIMLFYYFRVINDSLTTLPVLFGVIAGLTGLAQWSFFQKRMELWWFAVNAAIGIGLGMLHKYLFENTGWGSEHLGILMAVWIVVNFVLGLILLSRTPEKSKKSSPILETGARQSIPLMLLSVSLVLAAVSNFVIKFELYDLIKTFLILYGAAAIPTAISFIVKKEVPRNFGFITLAVFLLLDGINVELFAYNENYPLYFFILNGITALVCAIYFVSQKETWKNFGFIMLSGYLIMTGLAGLASGRGDIVFTLLFIAGLFAIPAAGYFFLRE